MWPHCLCHAPLTPQQVLDAVRALAECTRTECHEPLAFAAPSAMDPSPVLLLTALWVGLAAAHVYGARAPAK
jgi:hypothetical protein